MIQRVIEICKSVRVLFIDLLCQIIFLNAHPYAALRKIVVIDTLFIATQNMA